MKKLISLLISLSVILTCMSGISLVASAATTLSGAGTTDDPYLISTAEQFVAIFGSGNTDTATTHADGVTYLLTADIDLTNSAYKPATVLFQGNLWGALDGETKHKITLASTFTNVATDYYTTGTQQHVGSLFHSIENAEVKNLEIYGTASTAITGNGYYGVVTGNAKKSTIKNVTNYVDVTGGQKNGTAGIVGATNSSTIENCINNGYINASNSYTGGIIGDSYKTTITNCVNKGVISGTTYSGGIVGYMKADATNKIESCRNEGSVTATSGVAGGIVGWSKNKTENGIINAVNKGDVSAYTYAGGIIGETNTNAYSITSCDNYGTLTASTKNSGGIIGYSIASGTISKCINYGEFGNVAAATQVGGMIGTTGKASYVINVVDCYNVGNLSCGTTWNTRGYSGGVLGWLQDTDTLNVTRYYNLGELKGYYKGAIAGQHTATGSTLNITEFYDAINTNIAMAGYTNDNAVVNSTDVYTLANISTVNNLVDGDNWVAQEGYNYPSLKDNLYKSNLVGAGTSESPYRIYSTGDLKLVSTKPAAFYKQMLDITGMDTILCSETAFSGTYDGNGKSITLNIVDAVSKDVISSADNIIYTALFAQTSGATLKNITTKGTVTGNFHGANNYTCTTALVGKTTNTTLTNCKNYASIYSEGYRVSGLVGLSGSSLTLTNCYNYGNVYGSGDASGIIAQFAYAGKMTNCGNYGDITSYNNAAGITRYSQSANTLTGIFNVGTITATAENGIATGLFADYNSGAKEIINSYNAGALVADVTYGIAYSSATTGDGWKIDNCYNAVYADYPIASTNADALTVTNCYYFADANDNDSLDGTTAVIPDTLKTDALGDAYSIVNDYKYPQLTANPLDTEKDNIDFYLVTVTDSTTNETTIDLNTGKVGSFYLPTGANLKVTVTPAPYFYYATIDGEKETEKEYEISGALTVVVADGKSEIANVEEETISTVDAFEGNDAITVGEETYNEYSLVYAKVNWNPLGLKLVGFGILQGTDENMTKDSYENNFAGTNGKISSDGAFGILIHNAVSGEGLQEGTTYYFIPYGKYVDVEGNPYTIYGDVNPFTYNVVE